VSMAFRMILTFVIGGAFGLLLMKLKVPSGLMIGAMLAVASFNVITNMAYMHPYAKLAAQMIAGAFIACSITKEELLLMRHAVKPALIMVTGLFIINIFIAFGIRYTTGLDWVTCFFCAVPGGVSDMPIIAGELGGNAANVAVCQFARILASLAVFPSLVMLFTKDEDLSKYEIVSASSGNSGAKKGVKETLMTSAVALGFGVAGKLIGMPAGTLLFALIGVTLLNLVFDKAYMPKWMRRVAQIMSGAYIGCSVNKAEILDFQRLFVPIVISIGGLAVACVVLGLIVHNKCGKSLRESLLISTPAGASEMAFISADMGVGSADVSVVQIMRLIVVVSLYPQLIRLLIAFLESVGL